MGTVSRAPDVLGYLKLDLMQDEDMYIDVDGFAIERFLVIRSMT